jgi:tyrosine-protein phosphatase non-receptor type 23
LAQYHQALSDISSEEVGVALSRLALSETAAKDSQRAIPYSTSYTTVVPGDTPSILSETIKSHLTIISDLKSTTQRDNDFIFHKLIPNEAQIPAVGKLLLAKPTSLTELYKPEDVQRIIGGDLFAKLIPMSITQSASLYSEEKAKLLRAEGEKADVAEGELVTALDHLQLPGSLNRFRESKEEVLTGLRRPTEQVKEAASEVARGERGERTSNMVAKLLSLRGKAQENVKTALRSLEEEERECESMRAKYGPQWTQSPSSTLTMSLKSELRGHLETFNQAQRNDDLLESQWTQCRADIEILAQGEDSLVLREEFKRIGVPRTAPGQSLLDLADEIGPTGGNDRVAELVKTVERGLSGLNVIKRERQNTLKQLKETVSLFDRTLLT